MERDRTILFVDDDQDIREALGDLLHHFGYPVAYAGDGLEALEWLERNPPPRAILLDLKMPRCDGYEFRRRQALTPALAAIPVVVLTADGQVGEGQELLGGAPVLAKPVDLEALIALLARLG